MTENRTLVIQAKFPATSTSSGAHFLLATIARAGEKTQKCFLEFFAATIRNKNTRAAYYRAVCKFFHWCEARGLIQIAQVEPIIVAAFIEEETLRYEAQTVKQELAAIRKLYDYLVAGQIVPFNPAASVRGPSNPLISARRQYSAETRLAGCWRASLYIRMRSPTFWGCATVRSSA